MTRLNLLYLLWATVFVFVSLVIATRGREASVFYGIAETGENSIHCETAVIIKRLRVMTGQFVSEGDLLVELERPDLMMKINKISHELEELQTENNLGATKIAGARRPAAVFCQGI